jgi:hypothetical protein
LRRDVGLARRQLSLLDQPQRRVRLQPRDDPAAGFIQPRPPGIVVVAKVKDVGGAWLDRHRLGGGDVVGPAWCDGEIDRAEGLRIVDDVRLDAADAGGELRPVAAQAAEAHGRGIDQPDAVADLLAQLALEAADQAAQQPGEHLDRAVGGGIGQGRAVHRAQSGVIAPG